MALKGVSRVKSNFKKVISEIEGQRSEAAVYATLSTGAGYASTMTPVDTSNLINSQYAPRVTSSTNGVTGQVGYTASYAARVHGATGKLKGTPRSGGNGRYWDPGGEPRFLEKGFDQLRPDVINILRRYYAK